MRIIFAILAVAIIVAAAAPEKKTTTKPKPKSKTTITTVTAVTTAKPKTTGKVHKENGTELKGNGTEEELHKGNFTDEKKLHKANFTEELHKANLTDEEVHNSSFIDLSNHTQFEDVDTTPKYCYDSSWSFKCRQVNPSEYELECRIGHADGLPCFPDLVKMIEVSAPLSSISYPVYSFEAHEAAKEIDDTPIMVTADNIESISLHAPFQHIPADAFVLLPHLKKITLEALDGVEWLDIDQHAFRNTTAKHLHLAGHNVRYIMSQKIDLHYFDTITFSDVQIECSRDESKNPKKLGDLNCDHLFEGMKSIETLHLESIYVKHDKMDERVFNPMKDSLKKLTVDIVFTREEAEKKLWYKDLAKSNGTRPVIHHGHFPVETFAFMTRLEDMELYLYNPIIGLSIQNDTAIPLPVAKTLTRLVLSCRYCKEVSLKELGKMLPNLHHLTIAAPLNQDEVTDLCLKSFSKLEELVIFSGNFHSIKPGAFKSTPSLKHLAIKYSPLEESLEDKHWEGLEESLESLAIVGTTAKHINISKLAHLVSLDISQNNLTTIERSMLPEKAKFSEFNLCHNPINHIQHGFLSGFEMEKVRIMGWEMESMDLNVFEGIEKLHTLDLTQHLKLKSLHVTDHKNLPSTLKRIVVGRSPFLKLDNENGSISAMLVERNMTMVIEGKIACCCAMKWMVEMKQEHPDLLEFHRSRAMCSHEGTVVENKMPDTFWKNPSLDNFLKAVEDEELAICKMKEEARRKRSMPEVHMLNATELNETMNHNMTKEEMKNLTMEEKPNSPLVKRSVMLNETEHGNDTLMGLNSTMEAAEIMKLNVSMEDKVHSPLSKRSVMVNMTEGNDTLHLNSSMEAAEIMKLNASMEEDMKHMPVPIMKRSLMENMIEEFNKTKDNSTMDEMMKHNASSEEEKPHSPMKRDVMAMMEEEHKANSTVEEMKFNMTMEAHMEMKMLNSTLEAAEIKKLNGTMEGLMAEKKAGKDH